MAQNDARNIITISLDQLMIKAEQAKLDNKRLAQIFAAYRDDQFEIFYCFVENDSTSMITYKIAIDVNQAIPSICHVYSGAVYYEIEMIQMFGVNIIGIDEKFGKELFRIETKTPFGPKKGGE